ncbi:methyltransferase domain-containing protein [Leucobacter luti]|uniref:methyltransferase domain-containing protein n=1 Tax=Leucobacter luti TaxID=340320 RepID=UPI001F546863|nr:methyltransferase domain-containing protein [Leucobacter luti]
MPLVTTPRCDYFEAGRCRSCALIETPIAEQLRAKDARCRALLPAVPAEAWLPIVSGGERDFRNKAKLVVGGTTGDVTLGILGPGGVGVDLRDCLIQEPGIRAAIPRLAQFLNGTGLPPYDVPRRRGELKYAHVTVAPSGTLMLRFVVRTDHALGVLRRALPELRAAVPEAAVISVNLLPEHVALLEGEREEPLLGSALTMDLGLAAAPEQPPGSGIALHLLPRSFFQTNTVVARELYAQAAEWVARFDPASIWDLYCGVGGFALACAPRGGGAGAGSAGAAGAAGGAGAGAALAAGAGAAGSPEAGEPAGAGVRRVLGVEVSEEAVRSARRSAADAGIDAEFVAADATAFALGAAPGSVPELVIVNPPRRGIGADLAAWLDGCGAQRVIYSSCNPDSLAKDLAAMPGFEVREARVFDMFPHTTHLEVMVLLERAAPAA